ncbi:ISL3 family transposase [Shinella oryzae]|uniref:ISL3 family transposase n=2 Tax=Shinella oryzae TaxID=2871820 RepID=A0ABY9K0J9_9HYPH|nr:ISL3 family transposase [Shinella oryzae]WLS01470.1 ISL3 family transposase [Shinella oryzae]
MTKRVLPLIPSPRVVDHVQLSSEAISIHCRFRSLTARCPDCCRTSRRLHSRYERRLADLPWQGRTVTIALNVRRLRCDNHRCRRLIFAENHDDVVHRYCRRTRRLAEVHRCVGLALGGEAGARLVARLGMQVSADTILRIVRSGFVSEFKAPRILGVDDWAWRRGQRYGTVLVDLEKNDVVDLLPDREMSTLSTWLTDHPGVEIVARDRAGAYARGARQGAPKAQQIADRWHLLRNCSDALQNVVERRYRLVRDIGKSFVDRFVDDGRSDARPEDHRVLPARSRRHPNRHEERRALFDEVVRLTGIGWSQLAIRRELGIDLKTIRKWLKDEQSGTWRRRAFTPNPADLHEDYVRRRWSEGCRNATRLYREVWDRGYSASSYVRPESGRTLIQSGGNCPGQVTARPFEMDSQIRAQNLKPKSRR